MIGVVKDIVGDFIIGVFIIEKGFFLNGIIINVNGDFFFIVIGNEF